MRVSRSSSTVIMVGTAMALLLAGSLPGISPAESELSAESAASNAGRQAAAPTPIADAGTDGREPAQVDEELPPPTPFTVFGKPTRAAATEVRASQANWGPQQLLGEPDTLQAGDIPTAWASLSEDDQREWLILTYEDAVTPKAVMIHETYNPGAVDKVSVFDENGEEVIAWMGKDPTSPADPKGVSVIPIRVDFEVKKVKVYINSPQVPGWNEIDAVGLRDADGNTQWAIDAKVSSTYATLAGDAPVPQTVMISAEELQRIRRLETRVKDLEKEVKRLKSIENKLTKVLKLLDADEK